MDTYDCLVLDLEGASDVFTLAQRALGSSTKVGHLAVADFFKLDIKSDSEIGLVVFPVTGDSELMPYQEVVESYRAGGANLSTLLVVDSHESIKNMPVGGCCDGMVCAEWPSAEHLLRMAFRDHKLRSENRALKIFMDHSADGYWIWDIKRDAIEWSQRTAELLGLEPHRAPKTASSRPPTTIFYTTRPTAILRCGCSAPMAHTARTWPTAWLCATRTAHRFFWLAV